MKRLVFAALLMLSLEAFAQDFGQDRTITIWDNSSAPHSNGVTAQEKNENDVITLVTQTQLYIYEADKEKATGQSILVIPGGGYHCVCIEYEGYKMAKWLSSQGITCGVLKYRLPNGHREVPLEDAIEAMRTMRKMSKELNIDPAKVGIMGFSAGGHLAAYTSNFAPEGEKPAFSILFYPVITGEPLHAHAGSYDNLLGADRTQEQTDRWSPDKLVTERTPTTFLVLSDDDGVKPVNSTRFYGALKQYNIPASLHILPSGGHGWGFRDFAYKAVWQNALSDWLKRLENK